MPNNNHAHPDGVSLNLSPPATQLTIHPIIPVKFKGLQNITGIFEKKEVTTCQFLSLKKASLENPHSDFDTNLCVSKLY